jgi:hyperosmotically inducible protein
MKTSKRWSALALAALLATGLAAGTAACSTTVSAREQLSDAEITTRVKSKLTADPEVAAHNIDVDTNEGVVTLSGRVSDVGQKREAEKLARATDGVRSVINNLLVGDKTG